MKTYYEILQVTPEATEEVIKAAYKSLVKKYHPDSGFEKDSALFLQIEEAYTVLSNEQKRRQYDEMLNAKKEHSNIEKSDRTDTSLSKTEEKDNGEEHRKDRKQSFGSSLFSLLFFVFVVACFVTNMEQYRMQIYNQIGRYEFNSEPGTHNVSFCVEYKPALIKSTPKVWLNVDGQRVQILKEGDKFDYECRLSAGKHIVFVETKTLHINSDIYTITVLPDSDYTWADCTIAGKWFWGADFTVNDTYR